MSLLRATSRSSTLNAVEYPLRIEKRCNGTAAANAGAGIDFYTDNAGGTLSQIGTIEFALTNATKGTLGTKLVIKTADAPDDQLASRLEIDKDGVVTMPPTGGGITLKDNQKIKLGTGADAEIYFDATDVILDTTAGGTAAVFRVQDTRSPGAGAKSVQLADFYWGHGIAAAADGDDAYISLSLDGDTTVDLEVARIQWEISDVTESGDVADADLVLYAMTNGPTGGVDEFLRLDGSAGVVALASGIDLYVNGGQIGIGTSTPGNALDVTTGSTVDSAAHIGEVVDEGGYITSTTDSHCRISGGAEMVTNSWTARATTSSSISMQSGAITFYTDNSLTDGDTFTPTTRLTISNAGLVTFSDAVDIAFNATTGTKIGTATSQKLAFYNSTPIIQPTTGVSEATFVENIGGTAVNVDSTFGGYTLQQIAQALQNLGLLA